MYTVVSNEYVRGQWRPRSTCTNAQSVLKIRCPNLLLVQQALRPWYWEDERMDRNSCTAKTLNDQHVYIKRGREREIDRQTERDRQIDRKRERQKERMYVCVWERERERERMCVWEREGQRERQTERMCVCVWERERKKERTKERERERERERDC